MMVLPMLNTDRHRYRRDDGAANVTDRDTGEMMVLPTLQTDTQTGDMIVLIVLTSAFLSPHMGTLGLLDTLLSSESTHKGVS